MSELDTNKIMRLTSVEAALCLLQIDFSFTFVPTYQQMASYGTTHPERINYLSTRLKAQMHCTPSFLILREALLCLI